MGYIKHHAIVVTAWDSESIALAHAQAVKIFGGMCSGIVESDTNGYVSFFVAPDGSKEGWIESEEGDSRREEYKEWIKQNGCFWDVAEIRYGGDEPELLGIEAVEGPED